MPTRARDSRQTAVVGEGRGAPDLVGARVGAWRVDDVIASGGFGVVYAASRADGARGALKVLHAHLVESPEMVARLFREAEAIARLRHASIVALLDRGVHDDGRPYLVMDLLDGEDLAATLARDGRLAPPRALEILQPLCDVLAAAHDAGIVHRDIKASNVFLCADGRVVLLDFGIAKLADGLDLTRSRQVLGTPASMAPEQIRGEPVDARSDVYGLGALTFHVLTGRMPFEDDSTTISQYLHLHAQRPRVSAIAPVPAAIDPVVARAMAIDPEERFPGSLSFLSALRGAITGGEPAIARPAIATALLVALHGAGDDRLDEIGALLLAAERALAPEGFRLVLDLGESAVFVAPAIDGAAARALATALFDRIGGAIACTIAVHRGGVVLANDEPVSGALLDLSTWGTPDLPGVFASAAALDDAAAGERYRRLR